MGFTAITLLYCHFSFVQHILCIFPWKNENVFATGNFIIPGFLITIVVAGELCKVTGEYSESAPCLNVKLAHLTGEFFVVAGEFFVVAGEFFVVAGEFFVVAGEFFVLLYLQPLYMSKRAL